MELGQWRCDPGYSIHHMAAGDRLPLFVWLPGCSPHLLWHCPQLPPHLFFLSPSFTLTFLSVNPTVIWDEVCHTVNTCHY